MTDARTPATPSSHRPPDGLSVPGLGGDAGARGDGVEVVVHREQLRTAVVRQGVERVRVRREVVTEQVQVSVTLRREVLRVEREEITPHAASPEEVSGPFAAGGAGAWEMVLHQEQPVVGVQVVPVERVRVQVVSAQGLQQVTADVASEHLEVTEAASPVSAQPR